VSISEQQIRQHLRTAPVSGAVDAAAIIATGRRRLRVRRQRRALAAVVPALAVVIATGVAIEHPGRGGYELVAAGLTLSASSQGSVQVDTDRVDMGNGLQAWREGDVVNVGYASGAHSWMDIREWTYRLRPQGQYDLATFGGEGAGASSTVVVGAVRGEPKHVSATIEGTSATATIACFTQAEGWCVYATLVPARVTDYSIDPAAKVDVQF